jgi:hypothetical protein
VELNINLRRSQYRDKFQSKKRVANGKTNRVRYGHKHKKKKSIVFHYMITRLFKMTFVILKSNKKSESDTYCYIPLHHQHQHFDRHF